MKTKNWRKYGFEFLSIFIAVLSAFALNNWNENRRDRIAAGKIMIEISNGLQKDIIDIKTNMGGHFEGIAACKYWRKLINQEEVNIDSLGGYYQSLTRDFISAQNPSGYETLKSRGLELIQNDSLRLDIISLYEYDYDALRTLEEEYYEMQFQENYFKAFNGFIASSLVFDQHGNIIDIQRPLILSAHDKNIFMTYLLKIQINRDFILRYYKGLEAKLEQLIEAIAFETDN